MSHKDGASVYVFDAAGDTLAMHYHPPGTGHDVRVEQGAVEIYSPPGEGAWTRTYHAGDYVKLPYGWHEIKAIEDNTITVHRPTP